MVDVANHELYWLRMNSDVIPLKGIFGVRLLRPHPSSPDPVPVCGQLAAHQAHRTQPSHW